MDGPEPRWNMIDTLAADEHLPTGTRITIQNLSSRPELNGRGGNALGRADGSRLQVRVDGVRDKLSLRPANLSVLHNTFAVCLLATHISSAKRIDSLRHCLLSIAAQSTAPALYISWSAATRELEDRVKALLRESGMPVTQPFFHAKPLAQFEHYRFLATQLRETEKSMEATHGLSHTWVLFSDDDDVWHPQRLHYYCVRLQELNAETRCKRAQIVRCDWHASLNPGAESKRPPPVTRADEVDPLLRSARWALKQPPPGEWAEHWCLMVRLDRFLAWCAAAAPTLLSSPYCDIAFARTLSPKYFDAALAVNVPHEKGVPWLYAYNMSEKLDGAGNVTRLPSNAAARLSLAD